MHTEEGEQPWKPAPMETHLRGASIPQRVEAQAEQTPNATAVIFEEQRLTYRELNRRANQLAHYLRRLCVGPEVLVGVCMQRSIEMVVGLLGILKAGGAYVPLDPAYPEDRLAFMLEDAQAPVLLTQARLLEGLAEHRARTVCLDTAWEVIAQENEQNPSSDATEENLAYVIYTSGSTGRPKGVMITHKAVLNTLDWLQGTFTLDSSDVIAQKTSVSFTDSVWEFFWPLIVGAKFTIINDDSVRNPKLLYEHLNNHGVTVTQFVPPLMTLSLETVREEGKLAPLPHLKWVFNGGEALPLKTAQEWYSLFERAKIANIYGMTESAIYATNYIIEMYPKDGGLGIPIGKPIANTHVYLLNKDGQLCPPNVKGELCIGGISLSRGYLNQPALTAEKFIPNPFSDESGARLYKTGDLARYLLDGNLQYLGRLDHQVKIRGIRIELGEVEAVLGQHPAVRQVVVVAREDAPGHTRLVAYLVAHQPSGLSPSALRHFMRQKLPEYLVPSAFVRLDALPLTPSGKVDRRALPTANRASHEREAGFVAPRTPLEKLVYTLKGAMFHRAGDRRSSHGQ